MHAVFSQKIVGQCKQVKLAFADCLVTASPAVGMAENAVVRCLTKASYIPRWTMMRSVEKQS